MGVRAGQGYGVAKPKRLPCPECGKKGVTQWKATAHGRVRGCQYCQASWGEAGWALATGKKTHETHPFKVEARMDGRLVGRTLFKTEAEAREFAREPETGADDLPVLRTKPGDVDFC